MRTWLVALLVVALVMLMVGGVGCAADNGEDAGTENDQGTESGDDGEDADTDEDVDGAGDNTITAANLEFAPEELTVSVGDTVTFRNADSVPHDVEVEDENLGRLEPGDSFTWTPEEAGTFSYICTIHEGMEGTIIVE